MLLLMVGESCIYSATRMVFSVGVNYTRNGFAKLLTLSAFGICHYSISLS